MGRFVLIACTVITGLIMAAVSYESAVATPDFGRYVTRDEVNAALRSHADVILQLVERIKKLEADKAQPDKKVTK